MISIMKALSQKVLLLKKEIKVIVNFKSSKQSQCNSLHKIQKKEK